MTDGATRRASTRWRGGGGAAAICGEPFKSAAVMLAAQVLWTGVLAASELKTFIRERIYWSDCAPPGGSMTTCDASMKSRRDSLRKFDDDHNQAILGLNLWVVRLGASLYKMQGVSI